MLQPGPAKKLIITVNESARWHGRSVYNALLELFQHKGLAGATVSRGIAGFTGRGAIQTINVLDLASSLPVRIEIVDSAEAIERVLPDVYDIVDRGIVEVQETTVVKFATGQNAAAPAPSDRKELMRLIGKAKMLRVYIGEHDKWDVHRHKTFALSTDDPIMITIVDDEEKINSMLAALDSMVSGGCLIALSDVTVVKYVEHGDDKKG